MEVLVIFIVKFMSWLKIDYHEKPGSTKSIVPVFEFYEWDREYTASASRFSMMF